MKIELNEQEIDLIVEALDKLPSSDLMGDMMVDVFGAMLTKPEDKMSPEELEEKRRHDEKRRIERENKEKGKQIMQRKVEVVKAKLVLARAEATDRLLDKLNA